jgi:hypothetical protein
VGVAEVGTMDDGVGSAIEGDVVGVVGVVIVGEGEVGDVVPIVVGVVVEGFVVTSGVTFCGVTGGKGVSTGVTCMVGCKMGDPVDGSVPEPGCSTVVSLPCSASAQKDAKHRITTKSAM